MTFNAKEYNKYYEYKVFSSKLAKIQHKLCYHNNTWNNVNEKREKKKMV